MSNYVQQQFDVFLSHSHFDAAIVEKLGRLLVDSGSFRVWLDKWVLVPGNRWQQEMARGLEEAKSCAVCIGQKPPEGWFLEEIELALRRHRNDNLFRVIPVILPGGDETHLAGFLAGRTSVSFGHGLDDREACHRLTCGIQGIQPGMGPSSVPASSPELMELEGKLINLKSLRAKELIEEIIFLECQRRLVDQYIVK